jgi:Ca2+/H+ antiporter, TMEM165/GDT1 family
MNLHIAFASFASTGVEFLETAAIAYALARSGYRREALIGTILGSLLVVLPAFLMLPVFSLIPLHIFQLSVGAMLLWLGLSWCIKSIRRKLHRQRAGWIENPLGAYQGQFEPTPTHFSYFAALVMIKSAAVEGFEICMIVSTLALASGAWGSALAGTLVALTATAGLVVALKGKLQNVPEVSLKLWTGVMLAGIGVLWVFEGLEAWILVAAAWLLLTRSALFHPLGN